MPLPVVDLSPIERHERAALQFSGGKDSIACLAILRPFLDKITVLWANTGDAFPETIAQMAEVKASVPHFLEVRTDAPAFIAEHGWPSDVVPTTRTPNGRMLDGHDLPLVQPHTSCCAANKWLPLHAVGAGFGATLVIRGQRADDTSKSPIRSGDVHDGIEYWFPIEAWSDADVFAYLRAVSQNDQTVAVPAHYAFTDAGLDCMHCTGWLKDSMTTIRWMRVAHPQEHREVVRRLRIIRSATIQEVRGLDAAIHGE